MEERILPIGEQSFRKIRENGCIYVDKTEYVWKLSRTSHGYFLSRPRRFGKSLFISTLECYFRGQKDLFKGLYIEEKENAQKEPWIEYPVITFSLSSGDYNSDNGLSDRLQDTIDRCIREYGLDAVNGETLPVKFINLIVELRQKTGHEVVILVDEYDNPLTSTMITNPKQEEENRQLYKSFFSALKDMDDYIRFAFFTGVTKFSKVSIFSDLNQLVDISLDDDYSGICGITEAELTDTFEPEIQSLADYNDMTNDECMDELKRMYDGYHFSKHGPGVYNPFSLLNALSKRDFGKYWFSSGTPGILMKKLGNSKLSLSSIADGVTATESSLTDYRIEDKDPIPLFYQTGYLTICGFDRRFRLYNLKFPNAEVKYGFFDSLAKDYLGEVDEENPLTLDKMIIDLEKGEPDSFLNRLTSLFAAIPYPEGKAPEYEGEWSRQIFIILELMGAYTQCDVHMATGRCDCVVTTPDYIYVFEFKLDKSVDDAMAQIDDKGYSIPYQADSRPLYKIGVSFSTDRRNISDWKIVK